MKPHDAGIQEVLAGIIYFSFIFSWHVYFVPDSSVDGKRISVLDEMLCVVGKEYIVREAENLIAGIKIIQHDS